MIPILTRRRYIQELNEASAPLNDTTFRISLRDLVWDQLGIRTLQEIRWRIGNLLVASGRRSSHLRITRFPTPMTTDSYFHQYRISRSTSTNISFSSTITDSTGDWTDPVLMKSPPESRRKMNVLQPLHREINKGTRNSNDSRRGACKICR